MTAKTHRLIALAVLTLVSSGCSREAEPTNPPAGPTSDGVTLDSTQLTAIATAPAERTDFAPMVLTTGTVHFNGERSTQVIAPISGPVSRLVVTLGDRVSAGAVLATVASADFAQAVADYRKANTAWHNAKRIDDLNEKLLTTGALPRAERDQSASDLAEATADREAALSAMRSLGFDDSTLAAILTDGGTGAVTPAIRAPIAGTVVERLITPGQLLEAGTTPAFTIADLGTMWVDANVFGIDLANVRKGDRAVISTEASPDSLPGRVDYVGALVDPDTRATAVRIVVPDPTHSLKQNMLVRVTITSGAHREAVLVPVQAVLRDDENLPYLFIRTGPGTFARRRITVGARSGDRYEVTDGLAGGEEVVVRGGLYLAETGSV